MSIQTTPHLLFSKIRTFQTLFFSIKKHHSNCLPFRKMETKSLIALVVVFVAVAAALTKNVTAQNCACASGLCCSQYGYCGSSDEYCGQGCQQGPCTGGTTTPSTPSGKGGSVADIVTPDFFNGIINQASSDCAGKKFYSRHGFLDAVKSYSGFGRLGSADDSKREIAAFFAHVTHVAVSSFYFSPRIYNNVHHTSIWIAFACLAYIGIEILMLSDFVFGLCIQKSFNLIYLEFRFTSSCIASVFIWCSYLLIFHIRFLLHRRNKSWHLLRYHKY